MFYPIRTIITQDAEVDDQNSLRHILLYANEVEIQGIVQTSSIFHWKGQPGKIGLSDKADYDQPHRWTGTKWMQEVMDDYAVDYKQLVTHDANYPSPDHLRSLIQIGNIGYAGEMDSSTPGSELIKERILDEDPRPLYIQVWGGTNTIARALYDIEQDYKKNENWLSIKEKIEKKVILTACGEQDDTYQNYISEVYPGIQFVKCVMMNSYGYGWNKMPEGNSKETLRADFMKKNILNKGALMSGYASWTDGKHYEGEEDRSQFGSNKNLLVDWWGKKYGMGTHIPYDFLSEGDSPTFFCLLPWGLRCLEDFSYGGLSGRYEKDDSKKNSKGMTLNYWNPVEDIYIDDQSKEVYTESMWYYVSSIQRDLAARASWCITNDKEEAPVLSIQESLDMKADKGTTVELHINKAEHVLYKAKYYKDASTYKGNVSVNIDDSIKIDIPEDVEPGDILHIIIEATNDYKHRLSRFNQIIIKIN